MTNRDDLAAQGRVEELEAQVKRLNTLATDRLYMMNAYWYMLGPKGLEVAAMWNEKHVTRVHHDWTSSGRQDLTGEERAAHILEWEEAMKTATLVEFVDDDPVPVTPAEGG